MTAADDRPAQAPPPATAPGPRVLALVPAYEEGPRVAAVVTGALAHLPVLVVDDGSTDDTAERAREAGAAVLVQVPNQGKGAALRAGFARALADGYEAVVTLDADGQHDPAEIPAFLAAYADGTTRPRHRPARLPPHAAGAPPRERRSAGGRSPGRSARAIPDNQSGYRLIGPAAHGGARWTAARAGSSSRSR